MQVLESLNKAMLDGDLNEVERLKKLIFEDIMDSGLDKSLVDNIKGKKVYDNILLSMSGDLDRYESIKFVCSMITHYVIECNLQKEDLGAVPISKLYEILGGLISDKKDAVKEVQSFVTKRYKEFI